MASRDAARACRTRIPSSLVTRCNASGPACGWNVRKHLRRAAPAVTRERRLSVRRLAGPRLPLALLFTVVSQCDVRAYSVCNLCGECASRQTDSERDTAFDCDTGQGYLQHGTEYVKNSHDPTAQTPSAPRRAHRAATQPHEDSSTWEPVDRLSSP